MAAAEYSKQVLRYVVAQICQTIGWHSVNDYPLNCLMDYMEEFIYKVGKTTVDVAGHGKQIECKTKDFRTIRVLTFDVSFCSASNSAKYRRFANGTQSNEHRHPRYCGLHPKRGSSSMRHASTKAAHTQRESSELLETWQ